MKSIRVSRLRRRYGLWLAQTTLLANLAHGEGST